jgi:trehalose synthase
MLELVPIGSRPVADLRGVAPDALLDDLARSAAALRGARVLHVNATPYGGGVSELLRSTVSMLNDLGLVADWKIIHGDERFFQVTKKIHNGLQGAAGRITPADREAYLETSRRNAELLEERYDFVFLHDPQPAAMRALCREPHDTRWVWRCHIDTSHPDPDTWAFLREYFAGFDAAVFTMQEFVPPDLPIEQVEIIPPAIDPLSPKNLLLPPATAREILRWLGVDVERPLVTQVSRFDPWKDPLGVIAAYRLAREEVRELQLALVGSMALDDPEGWKIFREVEAVCRDDPSVRLFTNLTGVSNVEVNAFQRLSQVVVQKSLREGFGLVVSEAMWKGTPVVAGRAGGIPLQMADGAGGVLVDDVEGCARALVDLLRDRARAAVLGREGRERVRQHFLLPRLVLDELHLMRALAARRPVLRDALWWSSHDPVCGMAVPGDAIIDVKEGVSLRFCSELCRELFQRQPARYGFPGSSLSRSA